MSTALTEAEAIELADAYAAASPQEQQQGQKKRDLVAAAALWLSSNGPGLTALLAPLAPGIIADGWLIGGVSAQGMTDGDDVQTGTWKPGATDAASTQVAALGLGAEFQAAQASAGQSAQAMAQGYRTALGRALVEGVTAGATAAVIGAALLAVLKDTAHATATALGQLVEAIGSAAGQWYRKQQVEYLEWLVDPSSNVCPVCAANAAQGPVPLGTPFESGDLDAPAHPSCRCITAPAPLA